MARAAKVAELQRMEKADENGRRRDRRRDRRRRRTTPRERLLDRMNTWKAFICVLAFVLVINGYLFYLLRLSPAPLP